MKLNKLIVILIGISSFCFADIDTNKYLSCFIKAAQYYNVPQEILQAIAYVESNYNPNAYNENINSYDIGLMQINSTWLPKLKSLGITEDMLYEPCQSVAVGAWILAQNIKQYGLNWEAVQHYNGNDVELKYATKIYNRIEQTYPELLHQSQVKLIPIIDKKNIKKPSEAISQSSNLKVNQLKNITGIENKTNQNHLNNDQDIDIILYKSGVKITNNKVNKKESINTQAEKNINEILLKSGVSTKLVKSQNLNKSIVANIKINESIKTPIIFEKIVKESNNVIAKTENLNYLNVFFNYCNDEKIIKNSVDLYQIYNVYFINKILNIDMKIYQNAELNKIEQVTKIDRKKKLKSNKKSYIKRIHNLAPSMLVL
jgi:hypothetical protein